MTSADMLRIEFGGQVQNMEASYEASAITQATQVAWTRVVAAEVEKKGQIVLLFQS